MSKDESSQVYVETDVLKTWKEKMSSITDSADEVLNKYANDLKEIDDCWVGNAAEGFKRVNNDLVNVAKSYHNSMRNTEEFMNTVVNTVTDQ